MGFLKPQFLRITPHPEHFSSDPKKPFSAFCVTAKELADSVSGHCGVATVALLQYLREESFALSVP